MDYVYANFAGEVLYGPTGSVVMNIGDAWYGDDPFVAFRPDLFSSTPVTVRSTVGRDEHPTGTSIAEPRQRKARSARG